MRGLSHVDLDRAALAHIEACAQSSPILVGLSGGGDSTALLHLLIERLGAPALRAAIVDHALREGSADDARRAAESARAAGVDARVLTLSWAAGSKTAQEYTRNARYFALCGAAREAGSAVIALGHTLDDQAETMLMRASGGTSWRGLAGIAPLAPAPVWPEGRGVTLARPLLGVRRADLRAWLHERELSWIEDPANGNPAYERVRVRARLRALEAAGFDPKSLARLAARLRPIAAALDAAALDLIERAARFEDGSVIIDREKWGPLNETRARALAVLLGAAAGRADVPRAVQVSKLNALIDRGSCASTLGGVLVVARGGEIRLERDGGAVRGRADGRPPLAPLALQVEEEAIWDGRLAFTAAQPGWSVVPKGVSPSLVRGDLRLSLKWAIREGAVSVRWLVGENVAHRLRIVHPAAIEAMP